MHEIYNKIRICAACIAVAFPAFAFAAPVWVPSRSENKPTETSYGKISAWSLILVGKAVGGGTPGVGYPFVAEKLIGYREDCVRRAEQIKAQYLEMTKSRLEKKPDPVEVDYSCELTVQRR